jgi:hypothetical protein
VTRDITDERSACPAARRAIMFALVVAALPLGGCVASLAANAAGMAVQAAHGTPQDNQHAQPQASGACSARAAQYGTVHVIDVEQHTASRIIVWGTVDDGKQRRSFKCTFGAKVDAFKLRPIPRPR